MNDRYKAWIISALVILSSSGALVYLSTDSALALTSGDYEYDLVNSGTQVEITAYAGSETNVIVPSTIDDKPVVYIGNSAFYDVSGSSKIKTVTIPSSVVSIGNNSFHLCTSLASVIIPDSVTSIGKGAFTMCTSLTSVTLPSSITHIQNLTFEKCTSLTSIIIPNGVTSIGEDAFLDSGLTSVIIPDSVTSIGKEAFSGCPLTSVSIPNSVTNLGNSVFSLCSSLRTVTIGQGVTAIGEYTFYGCSSLRTVTLSNSLTAIGNNAFRSCIALKDVTIPNSVNSIGENVFYYCTGLSSVRIGTDVTTIGAHAFEWCNQLTSITFLGKVAPLSVGVDWLHGTSENIRGLADADSNFPSDGQYFHGLKMGSYVPAPTITVPGAPSLLSAQAKNGSIVLTWVAPIDNGGDNITGYRVFRGIGAKYMSYLAMVNGTSYEDQNASVGIDYYYGVVSVNSVGNSSLDSFVIERIEADASQEGTILNSSSNDYSSELVVVAIVVILCTIIFLYDKKTKIISSLNDSQFSTLVVLIFGITAVASVLIVLKLYILGTITLMLPGLMLIYWFILRVNNLTDKQLDVLNFICRFNRWGWAPQEEMKNHPEFSEFRNEVNQWFTNRSNVPRKLKSDYARLCELYKRTSLSPEEKKEQGKLLKKIKEDAERTLEDNL